MELTVLGSSSRGNCYILHASTGALIVEAGVKFTEVKKALNFNLKGVVGCIVSHRHGDHAAHLRDISAAGIRVFALADVFDAKNIDGPFCKRVSHLRGIKVGGYKIMPLSVMHDVPCLAYVIEHADMGRMLFVTDTPAFNYHIEGLNHILVEANYDTNIICENVRSGNYPARLRNRVMDNHMEIDTTITLLKRHKSENLQDVVLLHLSDKNSDSKMFKKRAEEATGLPTYIAEKGLVVDMSKL